MKTLIVAAATVVGLGSLAAYADSPSSATARTQAECASLFITLDKNGNGRISRSEASADAVIASAFDKLQLGDSGSLSLEDFMDACQKPGASARYVK